AGPSSACLALPPSWERQLRGPLGQRSASANLSRRPAGKARFRRESTSSLAPCVPRLTSATHCYAVRRDRKNSLYATTRLIASHFAKPFLLRRLRAIAASSIQS